MIGKNGMRNRILLIRPPSVNKGTSFIATQFPLNIAGIAAVLIANDYDVKIWDFDVEMIDDCIFEKRLKEFSPFLVGISCYTPTIIAGHKLASLVKRYLPDVLTVVGGPHVSALPAETLQEFRHFDIGVIGEGEETIVELARSLSAGSSIEGIKGIVYRKDNGSHFITPRREPIRDLDNLPLPARNLLNRNLYRGQAHRGFSRSYLNITEIMTSRGCPNRCIFCASDVVMGGGVRFRSAHSIKREIDECIKRYGFNHFTISDDTFILKEDRLYEICEEFAMRDVTWNCNARVWPISKKMLSIMAKSGCKGITFGVESGSPRILKLIKKNVTVEQIEAAFILSREAGIKLVEADIILGSHPSETEEDIAMTKRLLSKISPDIVMISVLVPYPGTEVYSMMKERKMISDTARWDNFVLFGKEPVWRTDHFSPSGLMKKQRNMIFSFYFRPSYIFRMITKMRNLKEFIYWSRGGIDFLFKCIGLKSSRKGSQISCD